MKGILTLLTGVIVLRAIAPVFVTAYSFLSWVSPIIPIVLPVALAVVCWRMKN